MKSSSRTARLAAIMDGLMTGRKMSVRVPKFLAEKRLRREDVEDVAVKVALKRIPNKGLGLVARRAMPANTRIGVYAGKVFTAAAHQRLADLGVTTGKYSVDFFRRGPKGAVRDGYVMDPGVGDSMHPTHSNVLAAFINEPAADQVPNTLWVRNYDRDTMELWTSRPVRRGEELTACYGPDYNRKYKTPCTAKPGALHYVKSGMPRPLPM